MARSKRVIRKRRAENSSTAFHAALAEARQAIQRHQEHVSKGVSALLTVISEQLGDPSFDARDLRRTCPPDSDTFGQFRIEMGSKPVAYLDCRRFEMARNLVCESRLPVHEIARLVSFSDPKYFTSWFKHRAGLAPRSLRGVRGSKESPPAPSRPETMEPWTSGAVWQMCLLGRAGREDAASLVRALRRAHPAVEEKGD